MRSTLLILSLLLILTACKPPSGSSSTSSQANSPIKLELDGDPSLGAEPLKVFVLDGGSGVTGAEIEITGDMTHAGMVPVIVNAVEVEPGLYEANDFTFTMAGDWIITTEVTLPNGEKLTDEQFVTVQP